MKNKKYIQMKKSLILLLFSFLSYIGFAQHTLQVQSTAKGMYVSHTVSPKENFYSVGRLYNISPKDIAAFNNLDMNKGLNVGQTISIPLSAANYNQKSAKGIPVYYVVGEKEGLYRVSLKNNTVLMANLRKWNNLKSDNISTGQKLIVGYLNTTGEIPANNAVAAKPDVSAQPANESVVQKQEVKKEVVQAPPVQQPVQPKAEPVTEKKPVNNNANAAQPAHTLAVGGSGYFKSQFEQQSRARNAGVNNTVTSGIFKTQSGWQDAKFYALIDKVDPGTIIQITNPTNNKIIYAKVLGEMSGIRQNQGLELRISSAAAAALEITDAEKFIVKVAY
jgi:LysM repeat protein